MTGSARTPLGEELRAIIAADGPVSVEHYMQLCLQHPRHGYYAARDSIGRCGDFITAPEIDQMFGELIGLWAAQVWMSMGAPRPLRLVELGPGRGTLMADALRATRIVPGFLDAAYIDLVETSPRLAAMQRAKLENASKHLAWYASVDEVPDGPAIVIANEFFDALPVRHYVRGEHGWHERVIGLGLGGNLCFGAAAEPIEIEATSGVPGQVLEICHTAIRLMGALATRVAASSGAVLVCDYGHAESALGETLQAVAGHAYADVLEAPGEADLTAHVDFGGLARAAEANGADAYGPLAQGSFLKRLGITERARALKHRADDRQGAAIDAALARFTSPESSMATLFKVLAVVPSGAEVPPGFGDDG